jgi:hypothetical protein
VCPVYGSLITTSLSNNSNKYPVTIANKQLTFSLSKETGLDSSTVYGQTNLHKQLILIGFNDVYIDTIAIITKNKKYQLVLSIYQTIANDPTNKDVCWLSPNGEVPLSKLNTSIN